MPSFLISRKVLQVAALVSGFAVAGALAQDTATTAAKDAAAEAGAGQVAGERRVDAQAAETMRAACKFLGGKPAFSVHGESTIEEIFRNGQRVQRSRGITLVLKRPDRLWAEVESDKGRRGIHYDGKTLIINDVDAKVYGKIDAPPTVEEMLDDAMKRFDVELPLADLVSDNPCAALETSVERGWYLGQHYYAGSRYHHLFFSAPEVDLQVWIADGKEPLFRKLVLTYKNEPGEPQYGISLTDWNFSPALDKARFTFKPPADTREIQFVTAEAPASGAPTTQE